MFKLNQNDDLDEDDFIRMATAYQLSIDSMIDKNIKVGKDLLKGLLRVDPLTRWSMVQAKEFLDEHLKSKDLKDLTKKMTSVIQEEFFIMTAKVQQRIDILKTMIEEKTRCISQVQEDALSQIMRTEKALLRGMIEATDVTVPSCFIILPQTLPRVDALDQNADEYSDRISRAARWLQQLTYLTECAERVAETVSDPKKYIEDKAKEIFQGERMYLYLVDEYTMEPMNLGSDDPIYPIEITKPSKFVANALPLMKLGLRAIKLGNMAVGLGRVFGFPIPQIPDEYLSQAKAFLHTLSDDSSVASYDKLNTLVMASENDSDVSSQTVRGAALREFQIFLTEYDPRCYFSGLRRVLISEKGDKTGICVCGQANQIMLRSPQQEMNITPKCPRISARKRNPF